MIKKTVRNMRRKNSVRFKIKKNLNGRNRLSIVKTNKNIYIQLIDDSVAHTIAQASTNEKIFVEQYVGHVNKSNKSAAVLLGQIFGKKLESMSINKNIVFDRGKHQYCGVVQALADSLRGSGLEF